MSHTLKYSIKIKPQEFFLTPQAVQIGEFRGHVIEIVVGYDINQDFYTIHANIFSPTGKAIDFNMHDMFADEIAEAFELGWRSVDKYFSSDSS